MTNMAKTEHIRSFLQKNAEKRSKKRSIAVHSEKMEVAVIKILATEKRSMSVHIFRRMPVLHTTLET